MRVLSFAVLFLFLVVPSWLSCSVRPTSWVLYKEGDVNPVIIIPVQAKGNEKKAAEWFQNVFGAITKKRLAIQVEDNREASASQPRIYIGSTRHLQKVQLPEGIQKNGICYFSYQNSLFFHAPQNVNLKHAVSDFFERELNVFYVDRDEFHGPDMTSIELPKIEVVQNPSFDWRVSSFPSSLDYNFCDWHGTQVMEEDWGVWGHGMNRILDRGVLNGIGITEVQALIDGKRSEEQLCFTSEATYKALVSGIKKKMQEKPDAYYYSIAPEDNNLICSCSNCLATNGGNKSNSNAVISLVNKLAAAFPDLCITTLAYYTTRQAPSLRMAKNTAVIISTIDYPKGIPIENSAKFSNWVSEWKRVSDQIFIWDYTVQYSNYMDFFPNMPALKKDLSYFKSLGVKGVYEQGSEEEYSLFGDYKNYVISKLLWNTEADLDSLKYAFFENAYPNHADPLAEFITAIENKSIASKKPLDIYGNIKSASNNYLSEAEFSSFYYSFYDWLNEENNKREGARLKSMQTALKFDKLEWMRMKGYNEGGYATMLNDSIKIESEVTELLKELKSGSSLLGYLNEIRDSVSGYCSLWSEHILNRPKVNAIAGQSLSISGKADEGNTGNPALALTDGVIGFLDYGAGWLVYNNQNLEISIPIQGKDLYKNLSIGVLHDPKHRIVLPSSVLMYGVSSSKGPTLIGKYSPSSIQGRIPQRLECPIKCSLKGFDRIKIVINSPISLSLTTQKLSFAIDEIQLF